MPKQISHQAWIQEGEALFGKNKADWRFVCPSCGHIAKAKDWKDLGGESAIAFSCVGRFLKETPGDFLTNKKKQPCNYAGGGLIGMNPVTVKFPDGKKNDFFDFDRSQVDY